MYHDPSARLLTIFNAIGAGNRPFSISGQGGSEADLSQVALFIDYENIHWTMVREYHLEPEISKFIAVLKGKAETLGRVSYIAAYADFDNADFQGLQSEF